MAHAAVNGIQIYYELHGRGKPLLLIEGLGYASWMWWRQIPAFSRSFQVIAFDNRGAGQTDKPESDYSVQLMAEDAAELLHVLGIGRAHVLGVSLGGFIAQELALGHPELVDHLVLWSTGFGGAGMVTMLAAIAQKLMNPAGDTIEAKMRHNLSIAVTEATMACRPDLVEHIIGSMLNNPQPPGAYRRQMLAGMNFDAEHRLSGITAPALIMTGADDRVVPAANAALLGEKIAGSKVEIVPEAGHLFFMEKSDEANRAVLDFLAR